MNDKSQQVVISEPRDKIRVTLSSNDVLEGSIGTTIEAFLQAAASKGLIENSSNLIAAICDGKLRELSYSLVKDVVLQPVYLSSSDGGRIYRRSLVFLMMTAAYELWPDISIVVNYAVPDGGFYCVTDGRVPFTKDEIIQLDAKMREIVTANDSIEKHIVPLSEAIEMFRQRGDEEKVTLLKYRHHPQLTLYTLRSRSDYYYGYMVPRTGYLDIFRLIHLDEGFILQYPRKEQSNTLLEITTHSKLSHVFAQTDDWLEKMEVEYIGQLNQTVEYGRIRELILVAEALHEQNIAMIANQICQQHTTKGTRLVLIAGPSSSGKTTFSKRLSIQLLAHGLRPFTLEMDNYFVNRENTPRDENGEYDFESIYALDLPLFNQQLAQLLNGERTRLPKFDFIEGKSKPGRLAQLKENQIIIIEGIHGLNPALITDIPDHLVFRVYISALTALNVDDHNRIPTTDIRLLRRIVRDARTRGYNATDTINRWPSVRRGEKQNIFPYQENADVMFNSALVYELAVLRYFAEPLLLQVEPGTPGHIEANRLLSFLGWVLPLSPEYQAMIPDTSLLREFIGQSILSEYHPSEPIIEEE